MSTHGGDDLRDRPIGELLRELSEQTTTLVRQELELAKAELTTKGKQAGIGAGLLGSGGLLAHFGLALLLVALVAGLDTQMKTWVAALVVGLALLALAGILALMGKGRLKKAVPPAPERAIAEAKTTADTTKSAVKGARS